MPCVELPGGGHICLTGPQKEYRREPAGDLWCFACRRRAPHDAVLYGDVEPSYYEPQWRRECSLCGKDKTHFGASKW